MHTSVRTNSFRPEDFANIGISQDELLRNLRTEHLRQVLIKDDGTAVQLVTTGSGERVSDKRHLGAITTPRGWQAITLYDKRPGAELLIGTEGVDCNPAIAAVLAGLQTMLDREGKANYVGCAITGQRCYMRKTGAPRFTDASAEIDAAEIAYLPGRAKGYLARRNATSNALAFLSAQDAGEGSFNASSWRSVAVPGLGSVTGIQPRITRASAVMIHGVNMADQTVTLAANLEEVGAGKIRIDADVPTAAGLRFGGMVGEQVAQIQADRPISGLGAGVTLVPINELPDLFGPAAEQFAPIAAG